METELGHSIGGMKGVLFAADDDRMDGGLRGGVEESGKFAEFGPALVALGAGA